jgi:hypothetical protein
MAQARNKIGTSFRLSPVALELIAELAQTLGLSQAGVVELAVRKLATSEGVSVKTEDKEHGN